MRELIVSIMTKIIQNAISLYFLFMYYRCLLSIVKSTVNALPGKDNNIGVPPVIIHGKEYHIFGRANDRKSKKELVVNKPKTQGLLEVTCALELVNTLQENQTVKAFVDTGAQVTVISLEAAKRCGLKDHIDFKYAGKAVGVAGSTRIVGRLRDLILVLTSEDGEPIRVVCKSVVVIKEAFSLPGLDLLIGLDILSELNASISLRDSTLSIDQYKTNSWSTKTIQFVGRANQDGIEKDDQASDNNNNRLSEQESKQRLAAFGIRNDDSEKVQIGDAFDENDDNSSDFDGDEGIDFAGL